MARRNDRPGLGRGLSAKILVLAVAFLLLGEILIFVPSIARYRLAYLDSMIAAAHLACLAGLDRPPGPLPDLLEAELLRHVGARAVRLWGDGVDPGASLGRSVAVDQVYDLRDRTPVMLVKDALATLAKGEPRLIRVVGRSPTDPRTVVDVTLEEAMLQGEMRAYGRRIVLLSLVLSAIVASLLLLALRRMIVAPLKAVAARLMAFRDRPEDAGLDRRGSARSDEIGLVERELASMQQRLRQALFQKTRLAALGAAVGQVSHDLKNILASAVLISDRLETAADPAVRAMAARLLQTLERAVRLCVDTLEFASEHPPEPKITRFALHELVEEVTAEVTADAAGLVVQARIEPALTVAADRDQLYRVLLNLARNSHEALAGRPGRITLAALAADGIVQITFADDGPGIPEALTGRLFQTFSGSTKAGGSGLGLAICREILRAHGGEIELAETGPTGTMFTLSLPDRAGQPAG